MPKLTFTATAGYTWVKHRRIATSTTTVGVVYDLAGWPLGARIIGTDADKAVVVRDSSGTGQEPRISSSGLVLSRREDVLEHAVCAPGHRALKPGARVMRKLVVKLVTAIIKPFKLDEVRESAVRHRRAGHHGHRGQGLRRQKGHTELYRGAEYVVDFLPKVKVEAAIKDDMLDQVIEAIEKSANTGKIGDGKIFVFDLEAGRPHPHRRDRRGSALGERIT